MCRHQGLHLGRIIRILLGILVDPPISRVQLFSLLTMHQKAHLVTIRGPSVGGMI